MKNKTIRSLSDLRPYGINLLTGESCALSRRLLCDVNEHGKSLILKALGLREISMAADWNGGDAIGSILLDRETLQTITILALFEDESTIEVWEDGGAFSAMDAETLHYYNNADPTITENIRKYRIPNRTGRNVHQMTGRTV